MKGAMLKAQETARNFLGMGIAVDPVAKGTGLDLDTVLKLKKDVDSSKKTLILVEILSNETSNAFSPIATAGFGAVAGALSAFGLNLWLNRRAAIARNRMNIAYNISSLSTLLNSVRPKIAIFHISSEALRLIFDL